MLAIGVKTLYTAVFMKSFHKVEPPKGNYPKYQRDQKQVWTVLTKINQIKILFFELVIQPN